MTDLVIRALSKSDAQLFDTLPDPLGVGRALARATHRPDWNGYARSPYRAAARRRRRLDVRSRSVP